MKAMVCVFAAIRTGNKEDLKRFTHAMRIDNEFSGEFMKDFREARDDVKDFIRRCAPQIYFLAIKA